MSRETETANAIGVGFVLGIVLSSLVWGLAMNVHPCYKQGFTDAKAGKKSYILTEHLDGSKTWEEKK